jgi:hypothetical protein
VEAASKPTICDCLLASTAKALNQPPEIFDRLHPSQRRFPVGHKRRHAAHSQTRGLTFIRQYARSKLVICERLSQRITIEPQPVRQRTQHVRVADVFASFKERRKISLW